MPDWISHILIGLIICELCKIERKSLLIFGTILPDIILKTSLLSIIFPIAEKELRYMFLPLHNPVGLIFVTAVIMVIIFNYSFKKGFLLISIGWLSHVLADIMNKEFIPFQQKYLFPFSWRAFEVGPIWHDQYYFALIPLAFIYFTIKIIKYYSKNKTIKNTA